MRSVANEGTNENIKKTRMYASIAIEMIAEAAQDHPVDLSLSSII